MVIFFCFVCLLLTPEGGPRPVKNKHKWGGMAWGGAGGKEVYVCIDRISTKNKVFNGMGIYQFCNNSTG